MNIGIRKTIYSSIASVGILLCLISTTVVAQDSFREFDRKMVATPAELYELLSTFNPTKLSEQIDPERLKKIEEAGRDLLSKLSPEQKDKAWEFAEKYLRKNGVDAASSRKLMQKFGLPPELQNELAKQFRKYGNRQEDPDANSGRDEDDEISKLLKKAREQFRKAELQNQSEGGKEAVPTDGSLPLTKEGEQRPNSRAASRANPNSRDTPNAEGNSSRPRNSQLPGERSGVVPESPFGQPFREPGESRNATDRSQRNGQASRRNSERPNPSARRPRPGNPMDIPGSNEADKGRSTDDEIDQLMKRLDGLKKGLEKPGNAPGADARSRAASANTDAEWEKLIEKLAER